MRAGIEILRYDIRGLVNTFGVSLCACAWLSEEMEDRVLALV
jgi:hypothetical protein